MDVIYPLDLQVYMPTVEPLKPALYCLITSGSFTLWSVKVDISLRDIMTKLKLMQK